MMDGAAVDQGQELECKRRNRFDSIDIVFPPFLMKAAATTYVDMPGEARKWVSDIWPCFAIEYSACPRADRKANHMLVLIMKRLGETRREER